MSLTTEIARKGDIYRQIHKNIKAYECVPLLQEYPIVHKPITNTCFSTAGMSVIYAVREWLFGKYSINDTIASGVEYTPNFGSLPVDAVCNSMRDSFSRKKIIVSQLGKMLPVDLEPTVLDVSQIVASFPRVIAHLKGLPHYTNPLFSLGYLVGGADANFIIDDTIYQVITTAKKIPITLDKILQPIGYAMLDGNNEYGLKKLSWYLPRQEVIITRNLSDIMIDVDKKINNKKQLPGANNKKFFTNYDNAVALPF